MTDKEIMDRLSYNLDLHLRRRELSRKQAATISGEHPMCAQRIVAKVNMPRWCGVVRLAAGIGISLDELMREVPKKNSKAA